MLTSGQLEQCRAVHEAVVMRDKVRITHPGRVNQQPYDPDLGYEPSDAQEPFYDGAGSVQSRAVQSGRRNAVEQVVTTLGYVVKVPVTVTGVAPGDIIECYESDDPLNVGLVLAVVGDESNSFATARRLSCTLAEAGRPA